MFTGSIELEDFYRIYGGQKYRGIATPKVVPYIYLIHSEGEYEHDNLNVTGDDINSIVYFSAEGVGENKAGNRAILEHAYTNNSRGMYRPLLLFTIKDNKVSYVGEYKLIGVENKESTTLIDYFILEKVDYDVDAAEVFHVDHLHGNEMELSPLGKRSEYFYDENNNTLNYESISAARIENVEKGSFVYKKARFLNKYESVDDYEIVDASNGKRAEGTPEEKKAAEMISVADVYNTIIRKRARAYESIDNNEEPKEMHYYVVNVKCGLTTFLVVSYLNRNEVWGFDWGAERVNDKFTTNNINACLKYIRDNYFDGKTFWLAKLFISHPDADHVNKFDPTYIDSHTEVWIPQNIKKFSSKAYNYLLKNLLKKTKRFVEPQTTTSTNKIEILHPNLPARYGYRKPKRPRKYFYVSDINNVSALVKIKWNNKSILLPGDIMQDGWKKYYSDTGVKELKCDIYIHSHHGSFNGFETGIHMCNTCSSRPVGTGSACKDCTALFSIRRVSIGFSSLFTEYDYVNFKKDILSTRDGAHGGRIICYEMKNVFCEFDETYRTDVGDIVFYEAKLSTCDVYVH